MKYYIKTILKGAFPSGEDTEVYEVDEKIYQEIDELCQKCGTWLNK